MGDKMNAALHGSTPTDEARRALQAATALVTNATPGPLWADHIMEPASVYSGAGSGGDLMVATEMSRPDAHLFVAAPIVISKLVGALEKALAIHSPWEDDQTCKGCGLDAAEEATPWPCGTVRTITEAVDSIPEAIQMATR